MIKQNSLLQHQFQYCIYEKKNYQIFDFFYYLCIHLQTVKIKLIPTVSNKSMNMTLVIVFYLISTIQDSEHDWISVEVYDMQQSGQKVLIKQEIHDRNLLIGENILSQHWIQKLLQNNYFLNKNLFRYALLKKTLCEKLLSKQFFGGLF